MDGTHIEAPERIAVVGISGRFPKSADLDEFWMNLRDGVECISFENEHDAYDGLDTTGESMFVPAGGVLDGIDLFDAPFFGINARDAETMDPQQRLFLECAWHSLEAAGYNPETYPGLVGVFAGAAQSFYMSDLYANADALASLDDFQIGIGNDKDHLTTQVAYRLNLRGPSVTVQTACSTSLVAVCVACQSLLSYQCDLALAGGVAVDSKTSEGYTYQPGGILSPDGRCRVFDAAAQGTVPGNGVGIVVLKRLSEALGDRDHICAVISGFALNNDGFRKVGYTAPSVTGQAEAVALAHAVAGVDPETISYIEAHGTGTSLGDPIEIAALDQVFCAGTSKRGFCAIGSVKSNIGHLDTAAGVAGLIKAVLALQHEAIPPTLHFVEPNPEIDFANSAFRVNTELVEWPRTDRPRRAGVSSFGIGGTNAHVVLEEAPQVVSSGRSRAASLLTISARTAGALETATDELANHLERHPGLGLENAAYTCHVGRKAFDCRRALVCDDAADAAAALAGRDPRRLQTRTVDANDAPPVCFLFPGQGTQELDMGLDLYREEPGFRGPVDRCSELLEPLLGLDLRRLLYPDDERRAQAEAELGRTAYTQPALFVVEYALARLWIDWGIEPVAMIGHSIGEYVAACVSGVLGLEDALELVAARGRLMDEMPSGAMLAVALSEAAAERHLDGGLSLAAVNGVASCVLSGPTEDVDRVAGELEAAGIRNQRLATSHAFHSEMMDPAVEAFLSIASRVALGAPRIPYISNVTGTWISPDEAADPGYWGRQLRRTVRFADGLHELYRSRTPILLKVGPGRTLGNLARQQPDAASRRPIIASLPPRGGGSSDLESLLGALGDLWLHGVEPDWERFHAGEQCHRVPLPLYPFERQSYWIGPAADEWTDAEEETARRDEAPERFAYPVWVPAPPSRQADHSGRTRPRWFVFADESDLSRYVIQGLGDGGAEIVTVAAGDSYACRDDASFAVGQDPEDYVRLLEAAGAPDAIAHLWNAARPDEETPLPAHLEAGFLSVVHLAQALERLGLDTPLELTVVTNGVDFVIGNEAICPARATVIAPCTVLPQEYPHISCRLLDIDAGDEPAAGSVVDELTREPFEPHVAHRNGRRWLRAFDPAWLEAPEELPRRTRDGGVYLVTGGLGRIATVLGAFIARTTADVTLVLTGRSELPPESAWDVCLENEPTSITAARIRNLLHLRASGAEVMYASADAADAAQMSHVIEEAESRFGPINGVVHAAGDTESYSPVNELDRADVDRQLRAKLGGAVVLDSLLGDRDLDFCVLLSSLSALVGGVGLVAYAAANCFLDALAAKRNQEGRVPWISIDWGAWHFPTEDEPADAEALWQANAILPADGESAFDAILTRAPRQVVVSRTSVAALYDEVVRADVPDDELELGSTRTVHDRPVLSTPYVAPRSDDEEQQAAIWAELLGIGPIGVFDNFFDLGGHSLLAIQLISRVRRAFGVEVPVSLVFDSPTIADLVASVDHARNGTDARVAGVLDLVEGLSDSEVRVLLAQEGAR